MIHTIVVGVDGTDGSRRALEWTATRAAELGAEVVAVFALPPASEFVVSIPPLPVHAVHDLRQHFEQEWCRPLREAGIPYRSYVVQQSPTHALVGAAEREHADLVVVGAHGHGGLVDRLLGSVSYAVSHAAPCPVVIVPTEAHAA